MVERKVTVVIGGQTRELAEGMTTTRREIAQTNRMVERSRSTWERLGETFDDISDKQRRGLLTGEEAFRVRTQAVGQALGGRAGGAIAAAGAGPIGAAAALGGAVLWGLRRWDTERRQLRDTALEAGVPEQAQLRGRLFQRQFAGEITRQQVEQFQQGVAEFGLQRGLEFTQARAEVFDILRRTPERQRPLVARELGLPARGTPFLLERQREFETFPAPDVSAGGAGLFDLWDASTNALGNLWDRFLFTDPVVTGSTGADAFGRRTGTYTGPPVSEGGYLNDIGTEH